MPSHAPAAPLPLLVTMGDAAGIGPEIVAQAAAAGELDDAVVVGDVGVLRRAAVACGLLLPVAQLEHPADRAACPPGTLAACAPAGLADGLATLPGVTVTPPQTNIVFAQVEGGRTPALLEHLKSRG
ncbi:MAG TPA: hypothetical protein VIP05_16815, partial [Burkholderiaceae bacterium]